MTTLISDIPVINRLYDEGFDAVAVTTPEAIPKVPARLEQFLTKERHGGMDWLANHADRRGDPRVLWPEARSILMVGLNYGPENDPLPALKQKTAG